MYSLDIGEYDFHNLKREQSIIVDFQAFPAKLIGLLKICSQDSNIRGNSSSVFSTKLDGSSGLFSVVESNEFKNLVHISLQLRAANDASIKSYLASRLHQAQVILQRQELEISSIHSKLEDANVKFLHAENEIIEMRYVYFKLHTSVCIIVNPIPYSVEFQIIFAGLDCKET